VAKKWFGPVLCPSGCCYEPPPPPPPPPCACADTSCFAEDELNFQSLKFEIDFDDGLYFATQYKNLVCQPNCNRVYNVNEAEYEWSGLSALNGTYDIPYYIYDDYTESWIEGDPIAYPCGVWFYPTITANLTLTRTYRTYSEPVDVYSLYSDSACGQQVLTQADTIPVNLETRSGIMWTTATPPAFPTGFPVGPGTSLATFFPVPVGTRTASVFSCSTVAGSALSQNLLTAPGSLLGGSITGATSPFFGWLASRFVGVKRNTDFIRSSDYAWSVFPYGGPGIPLSSTICGLDIEEAQDSYDEFLTIRESTARVQCETFNPGSGRYQAGPYSPQKWRVESSAWSQRFRLRINE
jgi:hypothetical protein